MKVKKLVKLALFFVLLSLLIQFCYYFDLFKFRSNFVFDLVSPIIKIFEKPTKKINSESEKIKFLQNEKRLLNLEIQSLRRELETREDYTEEYVFANVINFEGDSLQIDSGISKGVEVGQKVTIGKNVIGKIIDTQKFKSKVGLFGNPTVKMFCFVSHLDNKVWGVLVGKGEGKIVMSKLSQEKKVEKSDDVFCEGFFAGRVVSVSRSSSELFFEANLLPEVNYENLAEVYVVIDK